MNTAAIVAEASTARLNEGTNAAAITAESQRAQTAENNIGVSAVLNPQNNAQVVLTFTDPDGIEKAYAAVYGAPADPDILATTTTQQVPTTPETPYGEDFGTTPSGGYAAFGQYDITTGFTIQNQNTVTQISAVITIPANVDNGVSQGSLEGTGFTYDALANTWSLSSDPVSVQNAIQGLVLQNTGGPADVVIQLCEDASCGVQYGLPVTIPFNTSSRRREAEGERLRLFAPESEREIFYDAQEGILLPPNAAGESLVIGPEGSSRALTAANVQMRDGGLLVDFAKGQQVVAPVTDSQLAEMANTSPWLAAALGARAVAGDYAAPLGITGGESAPAAASVPAEQGLSATQWLGYGLAALSTVGALAALVVKGNWLRSSWKQGRDTSQDGQSVLPTHPASVANPVTPLYNAHNQGAAPVEETYAERSL